MINYGNIPIEDLFILSRWSYAIGQPIINDDVYNKLYKSIKSMDKLSEYINRAWSSDPCPSTLLRKYGLDSMIDEVVILDKTLSMPTIDNERELENEFSKMRVPHYVSLKRDGWNSIVDYYNGVKIQQRTRGRATKSVNIEDADNLAPNTINKKGKVRVIGELTLNKREFNELKKRTGRNDLKGERTSVTTAIATKNFDLLNYTCFSVEGENIGSSVEEQYKFLLDNKFKVVPQKLVRTYSELIDTIEYMSNESKNDNNVSDGIVVRNSYTNECVAVRIKAWKEPIYESYVTGISFNENGHYISIVIQIYPVLRNDGSTQREINITNIKRVEDYDLRQGSPIAFKLRSASNADFEPITTKALQTKYYKNYSEQNKIVEIEEVQKNFRKRCGF